MSKSKRISKTIPVKLVSVFITLVFITELSMSFTASAHPGPFTDDALTTDCWEYNVDRAGLHCGNSSGGQKVLQPTNVHILYLGADPIEQADVYMIDNSENEYKCPKCGSTTWYSYSNQGGHIKNIQFTIHELAHPATPPVPPDDWDTDPPWKDTPPWETEPKPINPPLYPEQVFLDLRIYKTIDGGVPGLLPDEFEAVLEPIIKKDPYIDIFLSASDSWTDFWSILTGTYIIREVQNNSSYVLSSFTINGSEYKNGDEIEISKDMSEIIITVNNATKPVIKIRKKLDGYYSGRANPDTVFTAKMTDGDRNILRFADEGSYTYAYNPGGGLNTVDAVKFTHNNPAVIKGLPEDMICFVEEINVPDHVEVTLSAQRVIVSAGEPQEIIVTNYYRSSIPPYDGGPEPTETPPSQPLPPSPEIPQESEIPKKPERPEESEKAALPIRPAPGGRGPNVPPGPTTRGHILDQTGDGRYIEIDRDGIPLGEWYWDDEGEMWIFDEYPPLASFPQTGAAGIPSHLTGLTGLSLVGLGVIIRYGTRKRGKHEA